MKKIFTLSLLLLTFGAMAQKKPHHGEMQKAHRELSPEQRATIQSKKMVLALDLTNRQQEEVEALLKKRFETRKKIRASHREVAKDSSKRLNSEERYNRMNTYLDQEIAFQQEMKNILSDSQFDQWKKRHGAKKRAHHHKMGKQRRQRQKMNKPDQG
ncbi:MAG: hypothetical protein P8Z38_06685 [Robiginitalea sp.]